MGGCVGCALLNLELSGGESPPPRAAAAPALLTASLDDDLERFLGALDGVPRDALGLGDLLEPRDGPLLLGERVAEEGFGSLELGCGPLQRAAEEVGRGVLAGAVPDHAGGV